MIPKPHPRCSSNATAAICAILVRSLYRELCCEVRSGGHQPSIRRVIFRGVRADLDADPATLDSSNSARVAASV
eukprot:12197412-Alexandrium_andersonii.AAC.1